MERIGYPSSFRSATELYNNHAIYTCFNKWGILYVYCLLLVKRGSEEWVATVILDNSAPVPATLEEYLRKLGDRVYQGRKDWIRVTTKVITKISTYLFKLLKNILDSFYVTS